MNKESTKRTAFISGSSAGIGRSIALSLAEEGFSVALNGTRPVAEIQNLLDDLKSKSPSESNHIYLQGSIADERCRKNIFEKLSGVFGSLTVLVNNAGITSKNRKDILELEEEDFSRVLNVNLMAPFMLTQKLCPLLIKSEQKSYIVNISSISAYSASVNRADYCVSKAGMSMMTQLYALRLVSEGVRVFEIRPGIIETDMTAPVKEKYDALIKNGLLPIERWGKPGDIAKSVLGIVNGYYPYATGEVINIDGGFHMRSL